jgi:hypothetical protein
MRFVRAFAFASQRRPASGTKSTPPAGRRVELRDLTLSNDIRVAFERHKDGDGRTAMLPATFAMAPRYRFRSSGGHEAYGAAQATAFKLIVHDAELSASKLALHGNKMLETRLTPLGCLSAFYSNSSSVNQTRVPTGPAVQKLNGFAFTRCSNIFRSRFGSAGAAICSLLIPLVGRRKSLAQGALAGSNRASGRYGGGWRGYPARIRPALPFLLHGRE